MVVVVAIAVVVVVAVDVVGLSGRQSCFSLVVVFYIIMLPLHGGLVRPTSQSKSARPTKLFQSNACFFMWHLQRGLVRPTGGEGGRGWHRRAVSSGGPWAGNGNCQCRNNNCGKRIGRNNSSSNCCWCCIRINSWLAGRLAGVSAGSKSLESSKSKPKIARWLAGQPDCLPAQKA